MSRHKTRLVGIVNVTPDSFSDGGRYFDAHAALAQIDRLIEEGAAVIDIGAESTRPGAVPVSPEEEWRRLQPVLEHLPGSAPVMFSIDTRHAATARRALACGAHWINDVSGFCSPDMIEAVKTSECTLVVMHSLGVPADKNVVMPGEVTEPLLEWGNSQLIKLERAGIMRERIIFDPGIGFGKTAQQSWEIIENAARFRELGVPLLIGHSRKSFLGSHPNQATLAVSRQLAEQGVDYLRVHDIVAHRRLLELIEESVDG